MLMEITLHPDMSRWIDDKVSSGLYNSPNELILEGLRLLKIQEEQRLALTEDLRRDILVGIMQLDAGRAEVFDHEAVTGIKDAARSKSLWSTSSDYKNSDRDQGRIF
ncbi:MAG: type II toxin-antitoxin system ParD family antitoxin [Deltaproteobacteria bacterium]|nr:type II toxin-antitoxin system ParD family antitoxin [Deltaproteobacteria bacterium]